MAEASGKFEEDRPEKERERYRPDESFLPSSHWFTASAKEKDISYWKPGRYKYAFFNEFNPKKVFNGKTKENLGIRKRIISKITENKLPFINQRSSYFKNVKLVRKPGYATISLIYKGDVIAAFFPETEEIKVNRGPTCNRFLDEVRATYNFESTQYFTNQVEKVLVDKPPDFDFEDTVIPDSPKKEEDPKKESNSFISSIFSLPKALISSVDRVGTDYFSPKPEETIAKTVKDDIDVSHDIDRVKINNEINNLKANIKSRDIRIKEIENKSKEDSQIITRYKKEITRLEDQIRDSGNKDIGLRKSLHNDIDQKNSLIKNLQDNLDSLQREKGKLKSSYEETLTEGDNIIGQQKEKIQEYENSINLSAKQILEKDQEISSLNDKLKNANKYLKESEDTNNEILEKVEEYKKTLQEYKTGYKNLSDDYKNKKEELENKISNLTTESSDTVSSIEDDLKKAKKENVDLKDFQKTLKNKNAILNENIEKLDTVYKANIVYSEGLEEEKRNLILNLEGQKQKYENLVSTSDKEKLEINQKLNDIKNELASEKSFVKDLIYQRDMYKKQRNELKRNYKDFKSQADEYAKTIKENNEENKEKLEETVKDLKESLANYKKILDDIKTQHKKDLDKQVEKLQKSNDEIKKLQNDLSSKNITIEEYKKKLRENENKFTLDKSRFDKAISSKTHNLEELLQEKNILKERNAALNQDLEYIRERVREKDIEVQGYLDDIDNLKETIDNLTSGLSLKDLYEEQFNSLQKRFENLTRNYTKLSNEHSVLVTDLSGSETKRLEIENEMENIQKELQKTKEELEKVKRNRIDPKELEEARNHVRELSEQLNQKENKTKKEVNDLNRLKEEGRNLRDQIKRQKEEYEEEIQAQKENYEEKFKRQDRELRNKFKNYMSPGEIKSIEILLGKVDNLRLADEDYDTVIKDLRTARNKFKNKAENPTLDSIKRGQYDRLRKDMDYRIDMLNIENNKSIETFTGDEILARSKKGIIGSLYRIYRYLWESKLSVAIALATLAGFAISVYKLYFDIVHPVAKGTIEMAEKIGSAVGQASQAAGNAIISAGTQIASTLLDTTKMFVIIIVLLIVYYIIR